MSIYRIITHQSVNGAKPLINTETKQNAEQANKFYYWVLSNCKGQKSKFDNPKGWRKLLIALQLKPTFSFEYKVVLRKVKINGGSLIVKEAKSDDYKH